MRLSPKTKQAFHETCEQQGESASGVIRHLIEGYVARFHQPMISRPIEVLGRTPLWVRVSGMAALLAGAVSLAVLPSQAAPEARWVEYFARKDTNGDGVWGPEDSLSSELLISFLDEVRQNLPQETFEKIRASKEESALASGRFHIARYDANGDGIVTASEFQASQEAYFFRVFDMIDTNRDRVITIEEVFNPPVGTGRDHVGSFWARGSDKEEWSDAELQARTAWRRGEAAVPAPIQADLISARFAAYDRDGNGVVSWSEYWRALAY